MNEPDPNNPAPSANPDPVPPSTPAPSIFSEGFNFAPDWADRLEGPDFDAHRATLAKFGGKSVHDLAKSYGELQQLMGKRQDGLVKLPGEGATPEEIAAYRKAVGVPESPDGYEIQPPEGVEIAESVTKRIKDFAHSRNWRVEDVNALLALDYELQSEQLAEWEFQNEEAFKRGMIELRKEVGPLFDRKFAHAVKAITEVGGLPGDHPALKDPSVLKAVMNLSSLSLPDDLGKDNVNFEGGSPGERAKKIQASPEYVTGTPEQRSRLRPEIHRLHKEQAELDRLMGISKGL